jgi:putative acetyltransferase
MFIRKYEPTDCEDIIKLFYDTVHAVNASDYTEDQLNAWTGSAEADKWNRSFLDHFSIVAVEDESIVGFGDIDLNCGEKADHDLNTYYLDRLYVHKDCQRRGIATVLCDFLERQASKQNTGGEIVTHASITAKPFFEKRGYKVIKEQYVERSGILLKNYVMKKRLK